MENREWLWKSHENFFTNVCGDVCIVLCINDKEKSGVVLGYFLCISQLSSQKAKRPFFPPVYSMLSQSRLPSNLPPL